MLRLLSRPAIIALVPAAALALSGCGESSQEKASAQVCSARAEISTQIDKLEHLTISTSLLTEAKTSIEAIGKSVTKIKEAEPNLEPAVKEQVEAGTKSFQLELASIGVSLASAAKAGNIASALASAEPAVKAALSGLATSYKKAYSSLKC